jgi:hypothetical protein
MDDERLNKRKSKRYEIADQIDRIIASRHPPASLRSPWFKLD